MKMNAQLTIILACILAMNVTVFGDTYWAQNRPSGSVWSVAGNWTSGLPDTADRANFTNLQDTDWGVDVDTSAVLKKILIAQNYVFNGTGSIELQPASTAHWDRVIEVNQTAVVTTFNSDVTIKGTTDFVPRISNKGALTFNGALTTLNTANPSRVLDFEGTGTTTINGDLVNSSGIRFGSSTLTSIIGGSGVTSGSGGVTLLSGRLELNRAQALVNSTIKMEGITLVLGADDAVASGADINFITGLIQTEGYDQDFGTLDLSVADVTLDMNDTDSVLTFEDSSAISWGTAGLVVNNADGATLRFAGTGLTATQIGQVTVDGVALTAGDTWTDGGYLYLIPEPATMGLVGIAAVMLIGVRRLFI